MKIKKKSIIIPAFALLIGASLAGSISGTVAWYQYSTRVNAAYVGVSGGTSGNLQMRVRDGSYDSTTGDWISRLSIADVQTYLNGTANHVGSAVEPITSGNMAKDDALPAKMYKNPAYGLDNGYEGKWAEADATNYVVIPLQLRYVERDGDKEGGAKDAKNIAKEVFLTELLIQADASNTEAGKKDLSDAIRFHINAYSDDDALVPANHINRLISKNGGSTVTAGKLDLDGDGVLDYKYNSDKYGFGGDAKTTLSYGQGIQNSFCTGYNKVTGASFYSADGEEGADTDIYSMVAQSNGLDIVDSNKEYDTGKSKSIGSTVAAEDKFLNVDITIWVEGWQTFVNAQGKHKAIWSEDYINSKFDVGFEFAVDTVVE